MKSKERIFKSTENFNIRLPYIVNGKQIKVSKAEILLNPYLYASSLKHLFTEEFLKTASKYKPKKEASPVDMQKARRGKVFSTAYQTKTSKQRKTAIEDFKKAVKL